MLGGARSGKSSFAQDMAGRLSSKVLFVATAEALDAEMHARIAQHRRTRPRSWRTLEAPRGVAASISRRLGDSEVVLVDCITLLVSNILTGGSAGGCGMVEPSVIEEVGSLINVESEGKVTFIIVSNEVGLGLVPDNELGRTYRDLLGRANQMLAAAADEVYFLVAGIPLRIKG